MQKYIIWGYKLCRNIIPNLTTSSYFQLKELKEIYPCKKVKYTSFPSLITSLIINGKKMPLEVISKITKIPKEELQEIKKEILKFADEYKDKNPEYIRNQRYERFRKM